MRLLYLVVYISTTTRKDKKGMNEMAKKKESTPGENLDYPHHMHFIAFNNDSDKIAYLEFSDSDFDGLEKDDDMESFFKDYFNYTFK